MDRRFLLTVAIGAPLVGAAMVLCGITSKHMRPAPFHAASAANVGATAAAPAATDPWAPPPEVERPSLFYDRFETIGVADGLPSERVTSVLEKDGLLAVGTEQGLALGRAGAFTVLGEGQGLAHRYVTSIARDAATGDLWIGTLRGLSRVSGGAVRTYRQADSGLMNDVVYQVAALDGQVWAATAAGTSCLDTRTGVWTLLDVRNTAMHEPWCYSVALGPAHAWIGVWGGGVVEVDRRTGLTREYRDPDGEMEIDLLRDDGPVHDVTSSVAWDAGVLWQASYFGLARYDGRRWTSYTAADTGLPGDFVSHVASRGATAWAATDQGLAVLDGRTCVSYARAEDGRCDVRVWREGRLAETRTLPTAPADNYLLWTQGGASDVWIATGRGLSHGTVGADRKD